MTVRDMKALLAEMDDDAFLVVSAPDHEYVEVTRVCSTTGLLAKRRRGPRRFTEDYGEETTPEAEWGKRTKVVVIGD